MSGPYLYLASRSPRRRELLDQIGVTYECIDVEVDESPLPREAPAEYVIRLALAKARSGRTQPLKRASPVLGADTAVVVDNHILGKPQDGDEARAMLSRLADRSHDVMTGVAVTDEHQEQARLSVSKVTFGPIDAMQLERYIASTEPLDKAGAYGIQGLGAVFVRRLEGSYSGVMGLPLFETAQLLGHFGLAPLADAGHN